MKTIIGIDPGAGGGIAIMRPDNIPEAYAMPSTIKDIHDALLQVRLLAPTGVMAYCERVGTYMPGNSGPSAATFAEHVGVLKALLIANGIPHEFPTPRTWMDAYIGKQKYSQKKADFDPKAWKAILAQRKKDRKNKIKERSQQLYPDMVVTLKTADALGLMWWGLQQQIQIHTQPQQGTLL